MIWNDKDIAVLKQDLRKRGIPSRLWDTIVEEAQAMPSDEKVTEYLDRVERDRFWF
jgi:ribosomal protein S18 acetylase RimI-like enzyme